MRKTLIVLHDDSTGRPVHSRAGRPAVIPCCTAPILASAGGCAKLLGFSLEYVVEAVLGQLDSGREPEAARLPHVVDDAAKRQSSSRTADDVRVHRERNVLRPLRRAFRIELVEIGLPGLQSVIRIAIFAMAVAEQ